MFSSIFSLLSSGNTQASQPDTLTQNGDAAHSTTNSNCLDYFSGICRDGGKLSDDMSKRIVQLLPRCWNESPLDTLKLIFHKRDCRGGSGEKKIFEVSFKWLIDNHPATALANLKFVPEFGYYKDLLNFLPTSVGKEVYSLFANQLNEDLTVLRNYNEQKEQKDDNDLVSQVIRLPSISLAAKWAPTLGCHHDKKYGACKSIAQSLGFNNQWQARYRKDVIVPLREHLKVVERLMSSNRWNEIDFSKVPSVAMKKLKGAFERHDPTRFASWLNSVKSGTAKINAKQLMPHELVKNIDAVSEEQWKVLVEETKKLGRFDRVLPVCDLSGSMTCGDGTAYWVSVALGVLIAQCSRAPFDGLMVTFSDNPQFFKLTGNSLAGNVQSIRSSPSQGFNTDLVKTFKVLLERARQNNVSPNNMPEKILIISDMQFDQANPGLNVGSYATIKGLYETSGYQLPQVVFWNVNGNAKTFPVRRDEYNTCTVSGFSPSILKTVLSGDIPDPYTIMRRAIDDERYSCLTV